MNPVLTKSYRIASAIAGFLVLKAAADGTVAAATAGTDKLIGTSGELGADAGGMVDVTQVGIGRVRLGGNVAAGDFLTANADSKAVVAAPVAGSVIRTFGQALADGAADDIIPYLAVPGAIATPAA